MKRKWRWFFEKSAKRDYEEIDLPSSRPEVFFDVIKNQYQVLLGIAALMFVFALPFLGVHLYLDLEKALAYQALQAATITEEVYETRILLYSRLLLVAVPIGSMIFSLGLAGFARIFKRLCFLQPIFFFDDFKKGIRENALPFIGMAFFSSAIFTLFAWIRTLDPSHFFLSILWALSLVFAYPSFLFFVTVSSLYQTRFFSALSIALRIYARSFLPFLPLLLCFVAPLAAEFIPDVVIKYIVLALSLVLFGPLLFLAFFLFSYWRFDRYINHERYPELVDRGIHRKKQEK